MHAVLKGSIAVLGALALAGTAFAQQGGGQGQGQGGQGARPAGQGGPPPGGGGGGGGGPGGPGAGGRPAGPPPFTGKPIFAELKGGDAHGNVTVVVNPPEGTACYLMNVTNLVDVTAAHIHRGAAGADGPPVVPLTAPTQGSAGGCATVTADVANQLLANPGQYYVNVHTRAQPNGAIRGQLNGDITRPLSHP